MTSVFRAAWRKLYDDDERQALRAEEEVGDLDVLVKQKLEAAHKTKVVQGEDDAVPADYEGPVVPAGDEPLSKEFIEALVDLFTAHAEANDSKEHLLPVTYVRRILSRVEAELSKLGTVVDLAVPEGGELSIVGDTHGQLLDVLTIFKLRGWPSETNVFLFNGDFVDRGPHGMEVLLLLYCLKLHIPSSIYFNRGNHEHPRLNSKYHFEDQVLDRYDDSVFDAIQKTFVQLPLASLIDGKVFVLHGGLFGYPDVTLDEIRQIDRRRALPRHKHLTERADFIMEQMLWSDPKEIEGSRPSTRGAGVHFGQDVTAQFLENNGLSMIVRSHECESAGFEPHHDGRLVTIFSASYYGGTHDNQGAIMVFSDKNSDSKPSYMQYYASVNVMGSDSADSLEEELQKETLHRLHERIVGNRGGLFAGFKAVDTEGTGTVTAAQWADVMAAGIPLEGLPWENLLPYLAALGDDSSTVNYFQFLDRYRINFNKKKYKRWCGSVTERICSLLYTNFGDLETAFAAADSNGDGRVSLDEFTAICQKVDLPLTEAQIYEFVRSFDDNDDGHIDYSEFADRFGAGMLEEGANAHPEFINSQISIISEKLSELTEGVPGKRRLKAAFLAMSDTKSIHYGEFRTALKDVLGLDYTEDQANMLAAHIDTNDSGRISYKEFKRAFVLKDKTQDAANWESAVLEQAMVTLYRSKTQLKRMFRQLDLDGSGTLSLEEFQLGMQTLSEIQKTGLSEYQIASLFTVLDKNGDGEIDYSEFISSFEVVDTNASA